MAKKNKAGKFISILDSSITEEKLEKFEKGELEFSPLIKSIVTAIDKNDKEIQRLAFTEDPDSPNRYGGLYFEKIALLPDRLIKRIAATDSLVASILTVRANQASPFGRVLENRFAYGFRIEPNHSSDFDKLDPEKKEDLKKRAQDATIKLFNCGSKVDWDDNKLMTLPTFMSISARNGTQFGRFATEVIYDVKGRVHSFRPVDPGTIYKALPKTHAADSVRKEGLRRLAELKNEKLKPERFENDEYAWIQVIDGKPIQAFTAKEMIVQNCWHNTDLELNGYPITPIDIAISEITTHINITNLNKLYFQNGRASKGMLVINSDDIDVGTLQDMKQQFTASINSVNHAYKMPLIKVGKEDKVEWRPIDQGSRDMEFQYLSDANARSILAAFQMSPDEIPGYNHLSRATNTQAMSETNNEFKLEAARDAGIRPLLSNLQDFLNSRILPLFDDELAKYYCVKLHGLDAETAEKENLRIQEEMASHATYDEILVKVEKHPIGKELGGQFPLNPQMQAILDRYLTVGQILERFFGIKDASKDPRWDYCRDQFYFQQVMMLQQQQQAEEQQKLAEQQIQEQQDQDKSQDGGQANDLTSGVDQLLGLISKSEQELKVLRPQLMAQHDSIIKSILNDWELKSKELIAGISTEVAKKVKK